jgi:hypothetical protein
MTTSGNGVKRAVDGQKIESKTDLVTTMFENEVTRGREIIYTLYSSVAHLEIGGLLRRLITSPTAQTPTWSIHPRELVENVELAVVAFRTVYKRLRSGGMGLERDLEYELWQQNVGRRLLPIKRALP